MQLSEKITSLKDILQNNQNANTKTDYIQPRETRYIPNMTLNTFGNQSSETINVQSD